MKKRKNKVEPCTHEETKIEKSYTRRTELPIDGYKEISLITCRKCNSLLDTISELSYNTISEEL